jgi:hypothetical protein
VSVVLEDQVEAAAEEVCELMDVRVDTEMTRATSQQPELFAFLMELTEGHGLPAHELAIFLYVVILRAFAKTASRDIRPIEPAAIQKRLEENEALLARLDGAHPRFLERMALSEISKQPFVVQYLVEALVDAPYGEDPVELSEEESGTLFLVLKTVIDVLDEALTKQEG